MIVFAGLSIPLNEFTSPTVSTLPPVKRGDLERHWRLGERVFVIVDGEFDQNLAVAPGEIHDILRAGALVVGSSSMGAMRAAELGPFGMFGVGKIFELIRSTDVFRDDWLGHLLDPIQLKPITIPFVEILYTLMPNANSKHICSFGVKLQNRHKILYDELLEVRCHELIDDIFGKKLLPMTNAQLIAAKKRVSGLFDGRVKSQKSKDAMAAVAWAQARLKRVASLNARFRKIS